MSETSRAIMSVLIMAIFVAVFVAVLAAFILQDMNPANWSAKERFIAVWLWLCSVVSVFLLRAMP